MSRLPRRVMVWTPSSKPWITSLGLCKHLQFWWYVLVFEDTLGIEQWKCLIWIILFVSKLNRELFKITFISNFEFNMNTGFRSQLSIRSCQDRSVSPSAMTLESSCLPLRNGDVENVSRKCQHEVMFQGVPNLSSITKVKGSSLEVMDTPSWSFPWRCTFTYISEGIIWRMVCTLWRVCWISFSTSFDFHVCGRFLAFGN